MFSDRLRIFKIALPILLIIILIIYGGKKLLLTYPGFNEAAANSEEFNGKQIFYGGKIVEVKKNYFVLKMEEKKVIVKGVLDKNTQGSNISGKAIFQKDKTLKMLDYHTSNLRQYKIWISLIPALIVLYLFSRDYRFDIRKLMFKKK